MFKRLAFTLALLALPGLPAQDTGTVASRVLQLPPPVIVEGPYEVKPLGHFPGELEGISAEQDQIHHQRHYAAAVSHLNELASRMDTTNLRRDFTLGITSLFTPLNRVTLHEIMWENMSPTATAPQVSEELLILTEDVLAMTTRSMAYRAVRYPCWLIVAYDLKTNTIQVRRGETALAGAPWSCIPLVVYDLFPHASAIDSPGDPAQSYDVQRALQQPRLIANRLALAMRLAHGDDAPDFLEGVPRADHMVGPNTGEINAVLKRGLLPLPAVEPDTVGEVIEEVFEGALTEQQMALWMVWTPDIAVLAWDTNRNRPLLLNLEEVGGAGLWGVIPLLAYSRLNRPDQLDQAEYALSTMHWDEIRARVADLRAKVEG